MARTRVKLSVYVDLDPMPGAFHTLESAIESVENILLGGIPHYTPTVFADQDDTETARQIFKEIG